jgi:catalase
LGSNFKLLPVNLPKIVKAKNYQHDEKPSFGKQESHLNADPEYDQPVAEESGLTL